MITRITIGWFFWLAWSTFAFGGEPPKLADLIARMPVLSPNNEQITSCEFQVLIAELGPAAYCADVRWDARHGKDAIGVTISDPFARVPVCIAMRDDVLIYDIVGERGIRMTESVPTINLFIDKAKERISFTCGVSSVEKAKQTKFDPVSFLEDYLEPKWTERSEGVWESLSISPTGNTTLHCVFDLRREYPLRSLLVRSSPKGERLLEASVASVNKPLPAKSFAFPSLDRLSTMIPIINDDQLSAKNGLQDVLSLAQFLFAHRAMRNPETRKTVPIFNDVDWDAAERKYAEVAPALIQLAPKFEMDSDL